MVPEVKLAIMATQLLHVIPAACSIEDNNENSINTIQPTPDECSKSGHILIKSVS
jgi:hypothetical protein